MRTLYVHAAVVVVALATFVALVIAGHSDEGYTALAAGMSWAGGAAVQANAR